MTSAWSVRKDTGPPFNWPLPKKNRLPVPCQATTGVLLGLDRLVLPYPLTIKLVIAELPLPANNESVLTTRLLWK